MGGATRSVCGASSFVGRRLELMRRWLPPQVGEATTQETEMVSTSGNQKGGGYGSRQHVEKPVRTGSGSKNARPAGVSQIGYAVGDHSTNRPRSSGYRVVNVPGTTE